MSAQTVWLVGLMGAGKSAVGRRLAARLGRQFVDTDREVERAAGCTVAEIFARQGEAAFRRRERAAIDIWAGRPAIVALGGGAIAQPGIAQRLSESGRSVYLRARPETLAERVGSGQGRPLLAGLDASGRLERLRELLATRATAYEAADVAVDTDGLTPERVAAAVCAALGEEAA
jgi:shikimate kinase